MSLLHAFDQLGQPRVLVLGDLMLDRYTYGCADRISPEAPVLVLDAQRCEHRLGGAANVGHMLSVLGAHVWCAGVLGDDPSGLKLRQLLRRSGIATDLVLTDADRPTTTKERFVGSTGSGLPTQMLRVDTETSQALPAALEAELCQQIAAIIGQCDVVLISDYAKGVCTPGLLRETIRLARQQHVPVLVDPGRDRSYELYRGATLIKPNRSETAQATGQPIRDGLSAKQAGQQLCQQYDIEAAVITLDADGMVLARAQEEGHEFPTRARAVFDITGAGDMVLAMLGLCLGSACDALTAVQLANIAAGLEVDRAGVTALHRHEIRAQLQHETSGQQKEVSLEQAAALAEQYRRRGKRVVFTNGCFDLLHVGHVSYLQQAASLGDVLIVGVNSDQSVRRLKGPERPVIQQQDRAAMLAALACVNHVVIFQHDTPHQLLRAIRPDVLVKGGTYAVHEVVGHEIVQAYGGRVCVTDVVEGVSTTRIVHSLQQKPAPLRQAG